MNEVVLQYIRRGMGVFDKMGRPLGNVDYIQTPDIRRADPVNAVDPIFDNRQSFWNFGEDILEIAYGGDDLFDASFVERMEAHGYLYIVLADGSGIFILGDQIDHEEGGTLHLNVETHELLHHGTFPKSEG
jgi:hypothetical protein